MSLKQTCVVLAATLGLTGCIASPPISGGGPGATTTTEWKEGYGGDSIALDALRIVETTCFQSRKLRSLLIDRALETDKNIADAICNLLNTGELIIESVEQPLVGGVAKDAANYPETRPRRMQIKKAWWESPTTTAEEKQKVVLHEILPLIGLGDRDYVRSSRLQIALKALNGATTSEIYCDRNRLLAQFSGAPAPLGRWLSRELGMLKCRTVIDIFVDTASNGSFEDAMQVDMSHTFLLGLVSGVTRTEDRRLIREFESMFVDALIRLPNALSSWSSLMCQNMSDEDVSRAQCGNIVEFLFGASTKQKQRIAGEDGTPFDFSRSSFGLIMRIRESTEKGLTTALLENGNVNPVLVRAAIKSQSWLHLASLGQIQRLLHPDEPPSVRLLLGIDWDQMVQLSHQNAKVDLVSKTTVCSSDGLRMQARWVIDGDAIQNSCEVDTAITSSNFIFEGFSKL